MPTAALQLVGVVKRFGQVAVLDELSLDIAPGEAYGLVGPNGAGKTTTISLVTGLLAPDEGQVLVAGRQPTGRSSGSVRLGIGYVPQTIALFPELSVEQNAQFWSRVQRVPRSQRAERIDRVLSLVGLLDRRHDAVEICSGGMQRRLNVAVALLHEPNLLVLDEPTVGVDPQSRNRLLEVFGALRDTGTSILYTSHYLDEVSRFCDRIGVIDAGRLIAEGSPEDVTGDAAGLEERFLALTGSDLRD